MNPYPSAAEVAALIAQLQADASSAAILTGAPVPPDRIVTG